MLVLESEIMVILGLTFYKKLTFWNVTGIICLSKRINMKLRHMGGPILSLCRIGPV